MSFQIVLMVAFCCLVLIANPNLAVRRLAKHTVITKIECTSNPNLVANVLCAHVDVEDNATNLTIQFRFIKPIGKIMIQFKTLRMEFGAYKQYGMTLTADFCQISDGASNPLVDAMFPIFRKGVGASLHSCPYSGNFSIANFTVPAQPLSQMAPQGQKYKTELIFLRGKHLPFLTLKVFDEARIL